MFNNDYVNGCSLQFTPSSRKTKKQHLPSTFITHPKQTVSQELLNNIIKHKKGCFTISLLAKEANISETHLRRIRAGITKSPRQALFQKILGLYCRYCL